MGRTTEPKAFTSSHQWQKNPSTSGTFDAGLSPEVEICETISCDGLHADYSMSSGSGSESIRLDTGEEQYIVNWHTKRTAAEIGRQYRVRVLTGGVVLGHIDIELVRNGKEAKEIDPSEAFAVVKGRTVPLKFRIETGIVGTVVVSPSSATIREGETQSFTAALEDLHGDPLTGPTVTWDSEDPDVATVDRSGLATGVAEGTAEIMATAEPATGSATLTVESALQVESWQALDSGLNGTVRSLIEYEGDLIAGGEFTDANGTPVNHIARWNGASWEPLGSGFNSFVNTLLVYEGELIAGGSFTQTKDGSTTLNFLARWSGSSCPPSTMDLTVPCMLSLSMTATSSRLGRLRRGEMDPSPSMGSPDGPALPGKPSEMDLTTPSLPSASIPMETWLPGGLSPSTRTKRNRYVTLLDGRDRLGRTSAVVLTTS